MLGFPMALNIKPLLGAHYPFNHPEVSFPDKEIPLRAHTDNERDMLNRSPLEEERMKKAVKELFEKTKKLSLKKIDIL